MNSENEQLLKAFDLLAPQCQITSILCQVISLGNLDVPTQLDKVCTLLNLSQSKSGALEKALDICLEVGIAKKLSPLVWVATNKNLALKLFPLLKGAELYLSRVHIDSNVVDVVLTRPPSPSKMSNELEKMLAGSWKIRDTKTLLPGIAESAKDSFTIMTPFFDEIGAAVVLNLFSQTNATRKHLILRENPDGTAPVGLKTIGEQLMNIEVEVYNFRLLKEDNSTETFHAKVVLADQTLAYVGSSNMNKWSFNYSLELGLFVEGQAADKISNILKAVRNVSHLISI